MDYYQILGVNENASQDDIKKAYKKLAMKNHPDRGGDTKRFQEISQAYDTLSDPQKRQNYDAQRHGFNPFAQQQGGGWTDIGNMFGFHFGPGFANFTNSRSHRNKDLTIRVGISLKQSFTGTQIEARFNTLTGKQQTTVIDIPPGVQTGQTIRYPDLGDDSIPHMPRGNLNVQIIVEPDPQFERRGNDLRTRCKISALEAMVGCVKTVEYIDGTSAPLTIRPGMTHGVEFASRGKGFRDLNSGHVGSFVIEIVIDVPAITDPAIKQELERIYARISPLS